MRTRSYPIPVLLLTLALAIPSFAQVEQTWVQRYATSGNEAPVAIKTNGSSVYVLGVLNRFTTSADVVLIKFNSAGTFQWAQVYNGPSNNQDTPVDMTLDGAGNIYVVGKSVVPYNNGTTGETFTLKYNSAGTLLWASRYLRPDYYPSELNSVAVDVSGNVYVAGSTIQGAPFAYDYMTIKYNSSGLQQWIRTYNGTANSVDMNTKVAIDGAGNIFVTGESQGQTRKGRYTAVTYQDFYTIKFDANGNTIWARRYNSPYNKGDMPKALALDISGNVYITGESNNGVNQDYLTVKYDGAGNLVYAVRNNGLGNGHDGATGLVVNGAGEAFVTGFTDPYGNGMYNFSTIKYNAAGGQVWQASYNGPLNGQDWARAISMDAFGNVYVTGEIQSFYSYDFATVKYSAAGAQLWAATYNGPGYNSDKAVAMAVYAPSGPVFQNASIYVTGASDGYGTGVDIATIKYTQPLVIGFAATTMGSSLSNYPNPFNASTTIEYELADDSNVSIKVIDLMSGRELETISLGEQKAGKQNHVFERKDLRKGSYVYKIIAESSQGTFIDSKVMRIEN